ncbi:3-hydroxyacyl-CoA dehydrogenase NAD-binding domain-containing protein [Rhizobium sp. FKY42]|uniref:3-hydroxyacyl-CoA dehydrogenase NAD-binding domain-containing protein n=1 Tax=Rhizobium sp. FKY42 TaxID=2562310 RepID=UPI0010C12079|nr:3-hydroxyacyl-CoA dehydrogenase NAD-binding domain-containing protein [Rhizobium sp. FKY42]
MTDTTGAESQRNPLHIDDDGTIRIITMQQGATNVLTRSFRVALWDALTAAEADQGVSAILLASQSAVWCAGADLNEMDTGAADADPNPAQLVYDLLPSLKKPVIAVLTGAALGGGLELALSCHYRLANRDARIGLPEVTLGLLPGAGGTQLLPRAIGLEAAANLILSGRPVKAERFAETPLFDAMLGADPLGEALSFARGLGEGLPHLSQNRVEHVSAVAFLQSIRTNLSGYRQRAPGHLPAVDCLEAAATLPFAKGREVEQQKFLEARIAPEGAALRYAFLAERAAAQVPGLDAATPRLIETVAVIGAGTMGQGIALACAGAGLSVRLLDLNDAALERARAAFALRFEKAVAKGKISGETARETAARITAVSGYDEIRDCDLVIEAVVERMEVKQAVFKALDSVMKPGAILASNTSTLDLDQIASFTGRPGDVLGLHFFNPADVMRLLEVVRGKQTAPDVLASALSFGKRLRKVSVVSGVCDGFIGNRMIEFYMREALYLVEEGATPAQVDRALERWGMAMGPFAMMDLVGNDVNDAIRERRRAANPELRLPEIPDILRDQGWYGNKSGLGWYDHSGGRPAEHRALSDALAAWRSDSGVKARKISADEITGRCTLALVNAAAAILDEGIALRGSDIDTVYLAGFGFPPARGGPLYDADRIGLRGVLRKMGTFARSPHGDGAFWTPHPLLRRLAAHGQRLSDYGRNP